MPVQKVDFKIENVYDTANNISERLFIDIWTNGSISPMKLLNQQLRIIIDLFTLLINNKNK
jgi:DNA-directed RNA polymerase subunit alpha